jgi:hypothetical protein
LTAYYWIVQGFSPDPALADVYGGWGIGPAKPAEVTAERITAAGNIWADHGHIATQETFLELVNVNAGGATPWGGLRARFFGQDLDGAIHAADHLEGNTGRISGIQPSKVLGGPGAMPLVGANVGLGRTFSWPTAAESWSFAPVTLAPLA